MKKKLQIVLASILVLAIVPIMNVFAASAGASISCPPTAAPGSTVACSVKFSSSDTAFFDFGTSSENGSSWLNGPNVVGDGTKKSETGSISVKVGSSGSTKVFVSGLAGTTGANPEEIDFRGSTSISIESSNPKPTTPTDPGPGGTKPGTSNPGTSNPGTTKPDKELTEEEKKAKEEAEKKAQLEAGQKIPLIDGIKISSRSPKMEGIALETLGTQEGVFSYNYELPKNIDRVGLELIPSIEGVDLTYEKEIDFAADETSKTITANAKSGEISQDYEIVLTRTVPVVNKTEIDGKKLTVLDDDTLDGNMKNIGFERQEYEIEGGMGYFFVNGDIKLQLLVDENNNGSWHLLDEANKPSEEVILLESGTNYALVLNAPEAIQKETLNTEKYSEKTVDFESRYTEVSTTLVMNNKYKAWTAEDGEVFYGIMNGKEKRLHYKTKNDDGLVFEKAFVGFDHTNGTSKTVAIVSTATLGIAVIAGVVYTIMLKKKK